MIDHAHIPLFTLRDLYPYQFEQVCAFESFAIVRNPFDRFFSSVQQKMRVDMSRKGSNTRSFTASDIHNEIEAVVAYLSGLPDSPHQLPYNYIHFQRQTDYIFYNDVRIVKYVYCLGQLDQFYDAIEEKIGIPRNFMTKQNHENSANRSLLFRNDVAQWIQIATKQVRKVLAPITPIQIRRLYTLSTKVMSSNSLTLHMNPAVRHFIESYYKKDINLFESICQRPTSADI